MHKKTKLSSSNTKEKKEETMERSNKKKRRQHKKRQKRQHRPIHFTIKTASYHFVWKSFSLITIRLGVNGSRFRTGT